MAGVKLTSREFNQDTSRAKRQAESGPVFITDRGRTSHVLLSISEYDRLAHPQKSIVDLLAMTEGADIDFDPPSLTGRFSRPIDFD